MSWEQYLYQTTGLVADAVTNPGSVIERFVWCGVPCELLRGQYGANGYVYPLARVRARLVGIRRERLPFEVHGGISYRTRTYTCIGWDAAHIADAWTYADALAYSTDTEKARQRLAEDARHGWPLANAPLWTLDRVRVETRHLAEQVAALNYVVPWRPEHRAMRRRLQLARTREDE